MRNPAIVRESDRRAVKRSGRIGVSDAATLNFNKLVPPIYASEGLGFASRRTD